MVPRGIVKASFRTHVPAVTGRFLWGASALVCLKGGTGRGGRGGREGFLARMLRIHALRSTLYVPLSIAAVRRVCRTALRCSALLSSAHAALPCREGDGKDGVGQGCRGRERGAVVHQRIGQAAGQTTNHIDGVQHGDNTCGMRQQLLLLSDTFLRFPCSLQQEFLHSVSLRVLPHVALPRLPPLSASPSDAPMPFLPRGVPAHCRGDHARVCM